MNCVISSDPVKVSSSMLSYAQELLDCGSDKSRIIQMINKAKYLIEKCVKKKDNTSHNNVVFLPTNSDWTRESIAAYIESEADIEILPCSLSDSTCQQFVNAMADIHYNWEDENVVTERREYTRKLIRNKLLTQTSI